MTTVVIRYNYSRGVLKVDLNELFYPTPANELKIKNRNNFYAISDSPTERYTTAGRMKRLLTFLMDNRWDNEEAFTIALSYVRDNLQEWYSYMNTAYKNIENQIYNGKYWKKYDKDLKDCQKKFKLFNEALNILEDTKIDVRERVKLIKEAEL